MAFQLTQRDKYALYLAGGVVFIFLVFQLLISPLFNKIALMKRRLAVKEKILAEMVTMQSRHAAAREETEVLKRQLEGRDRSFTLFSFMDTLAGEVGVKNKISYMKPSTRDDKDNQYKIASVEMKLTAVTMEEVTNYLYGLETSGKLVVVRRLSITRPGKEDQWVDVVLQAQTRES